MSPRVMPHKAGGDSGGSRGGDAARCGAWGLQAERRQEDREEEDPDLAAKFPRAERSGRRWRSAEVFPRRGGARRDPAPKGSQGTRPPAS